MNMEELFDATVAFHKNRTSDHVQGPSRKRTPQLRSQYTCDSWYGTRTIDDKGHGGDANDKSHVGSCVSVPNRSIKAEKEPFDHSTRGPSGSHPTGDPPDPAKRCEMLLARDP